jgi:hypothetical protein
MTIDSIPTGPITRADVVSALGDTDPHGTNAGALRQLLGRGSFATIQKHLDSLRLERLSAAASASAAPSDIPPMPPEVAAMWAAAFGVALSQVRTRLDGVVEERDALAKTAATAAADVTALTTQLESSTADLEVSATRAGELERLLSELATAAAGELAAATAAAQAVEGRLGRELELLRHEAQLEALKAQAALQALQSALDRQSDQLADFKSALRKPAADLVSHPPLGM